MNWQNVLSIILGTSFMAFFVKIYSEYVDNKKKLIDLEYKDDKTKIKEKVKDDDIDTILDRISKRFR